MPWLIIVGASLAYLAIYNAGNLWPVIIGVISGLLIAAHQLVRNSRRKT